MSVTTHDVELVGEETTHNLARAALFAALVGGFAFVAFPHPMSTVPITLQVLGVFLAGIFLGPFWGGTALLLYLLAGAAGVPIFANGSSGLGPLLGPSGGYLVSYPFAALAIGAIVHGVDGLDDPTGAGIPRLLVAMIVGTTVIYTFGTVGYQLVMSVSIWEAALVTAAPFVPFEALKMAAAIGIVDSERFAAQ